MRQMRVFSIFNSVTLSGLTLSGLILIGQTSFANEWPVKMRKMEKTLHELLLDITSDSRFDDKNNFSRIEKNAKQLSDLAHQLSPQKSPDQDPSLQIIAGLFAQESGHAYQMLKSGHREYARGLLKAATGYCISCHTRTDSGPKFSSPGDASLKTLSPYDRGSYFAATRQFDAATAEFNTIISNPKMAQKQPFEWERAIRNNLAIYVRAEKNPDLALAMVEQVLKTTESPFFIREQAAAWKKSLEKWKSEPKAKALTEEGYFGLMTQLIAEAKSQHPYSASRNADVLFLRASSAAHELMRANPNGQHLAEGFYVAGLSYEALQGINLWDIHEFYYQACIQSAPHSEIARKCFRNYEESTLAGYTGSSGTHLPPAVKKRLKDLDEASGPAKPIKQN